MQQNVAFPSVGVLIGLPKSNPLSRILDPPLRDRSHGYVTVLPLSAYVLSRESHNFWSVSWSQLTQQQTQTSLS